MPILEQGYEPYRGPRGGGMPRALAIALAALRRNRRWWAWVLLALALLLGSSKEYFFVFVAYAPEAIFGARPGEVPGWFSVFANHPRFYTDMMSTQTFWAIALGAVLGAGEIAEDLRTGALVFYLGRPLTRAEYILGKAVAVSVPVLLVTLVPVLVLFIVQALFEGSWAWIADHARVPPAALGYSLLLCFYVSGVVLGISAVARRRRWATVGIVAVLIGLWTVSTVLAPPFKWNSFRQRRRAEEAANAASTREERERVREMISDSFDTLGSPSEHAAWAALSPDKSLAAAGRDLFGNELPSNFPGKRHWVFVLAVPLLFLGVLWRRVRAVEVVS